MLFASAHEASDCDHRCLYDTQQPLAREEGESTEQEGHTTRHIVLQQVVHTLNITATVPSVVHIVTILIQAHIKLMRTLRS